MKKTLPKKIYILGYGYAGLIAYHKLLKKYDADDIVILKNSERRHILTLDHEKLRFSPLPIFPVLESKLYQSDLFDTIEKQDPIKVSYTEVANFHYLKHTIQEKSLAEFMISNKDINKWLCLGLKQWGPKMLNEPFSQVRSKIERHYLSNERSTRIGYINGQSIFQLAIEKLNPNITNYRTIKSINYLKKQVTIDDVIVNYDKLISTIPLPSLLDLCGKKVHYDFASVSAYFFYYEFDSGMEENQVIYDCDYTSNILRIYSITTSFLLVQLQAHEYKNIDKKEVKNRLIEMVPSFKGLKFIRDLYAPNSYPTENIEDKTVLQNIEELKQNDILPFGRFGQWKYTDLHELDWSLLP